MSGVSPCTEYSKFPSVSGSFVISDESKKVGARLFYAKDCEESPSISRDRPLATALKALTSIGEECSIINWDGYDSNPIEVAAINEARGFLNILPTSPFPMPEIAPMPDGGISLEWYKGKGRSFSLSLWGKGTLAYAGLFGDGNDVHGNEDFSGYSIPGPVVNSLQRLFFRVP